MKVLMIKMSSLGDVIHTFPAVTEALQVDPTIEFHWVVEKSFAPLVALHPGVKKIIPLEFRKWRKPWWQLFFRKEWRDFRTELRSVKYDLVIDAQGLLKSALIAMHAKGPRYGYDRHSIREPLAALVYQHRFAVGRQQHAIARVRALLGAIFNYTVPDTTPEYGLDRTRLPQANTQTNNIIFLHGTTWTNKQWPETYWQTLATLLIERHMSVKLLWGSDEERERAHRIAAIDASIEVMPQLNLLEAASLMVASRAVVAVDTGLGHLAAALGAPMVSLYGPTNAGLTGALGPSQIHLQSQLSCSPCLKRECAFQGASVVWPACFAELSPERVFQAIAKLLII